MEQIYSGWSDWVSDYGHEASAVLLRIWTRIVTLLRFSRNGDEFRASLQTSVIIPSSLWQLQASTTMLVLASFGVFFLLLVHYQLAFIQSMSGIFLSLLLFPHGLCFFISSAQSPKQIQIWILQVISTPDPYKRLKMKTLLSAELRSEFCCFYLLSISKSVPTYACKCKFLSHIYNSLELPSHSKTREKVYYNFRYSVVWAGYQ